MTSSKEAPRRTILPSVIVALIFLCNPNITIIDILPDFVSFFILARVFLYASDCAPHFEPARVAFKRLAWLNVGKFFGLFIILLVRRENSSDSDIIPLITFAFAIGEILLSVIAIRHIFNGLFYLGNRSVALATIRPFRFLGMRIRPETVKNLSYFFVIVKCFAYFSPTPLLLTRDYFTSFIAYSPASWFIGIFFASFFIAMIVGIFWLLFTIGYACAIKKEGNFFPSLYTLLDNNLGFYIERKDKLRTLVSGLTLFMVASIFTLDLALVENYDVNMIPNFIYALLLFLGALKITRYEKKSPILIVSGAVYIFTSTVSYFAESAFLVNYGYDELVIKGAARIFYPVVIFFSVIEFITLAAFLVFLYINMKKFILTNTGINDRTADIKSNRDYYSSLMIKNMIFLIAGLVAGFSKLASVIVHGSIDIVYVNNTTTGDGMLNNSVVTPAIEWIGLAVLIFSIAYIIFTFYFVSTLKDEVKMKYEDENTSLN